MSTFAVSESASCERGDPSLIHSGKRQSNTRIAQRAVAMVTFVTSSNRDGISRAKSLPKESCFVAPCDTWQQQQRQE
jgi:hypothetical protein